MANLNFNGLDLQNEPEYIVSEVSYRSFPERPLDKANLSRRPGSKFLNTEFGDKRIQLIGYLNGTTASGLQGVIDTFQQTLAGVEKPLIINDDIYPTRTYTATCASLAIPERNYSQTFVPYSAEFVATDPFAYGALLTASGSVVSGTVTFSGSTTISGTVFAEPTISVYPTSLAAGDSGIKAIQIGYTPAGETLTASGIFNYTAAVAFNYSNFTVTASGVNGDFSGAFSRWEPGTTPFTVTTTSGLHNSYDWVLSYQPRYY